MRIALYTMHGPGIADMAAITVPNKVEYCTRHGYAYHESKHDGARHSWPGYDRLPDLIRWLRCGLYDWVFWLGTDCLITNLSTRLEEFIDPRYGMIIATDANEVQMDSFLVQRGARGEELLQRIWDTRFVSYGPNQEQSNLDAKIKVEGFGRSVKIIPQRKLNSYNYDLYAHEKAQGFAAKTDFFGNDGQWRPGDFVFHVPGRGADVKIATLRDMLAQVQNKPVESYLRTVVESIPLSAPKVCILTCHDDNYLPMAQRTVYQNKAEYARKWGHDMITLTNVNPQFKDPHSHVSGMTWDRLREAVKIAKGGKYEWLWVVGSDTLITNMTIPLSSLIDDGYHFIIANDQNGWNADSFFIRCSPKGIAYMEDVMSQYDRLKCHPIVEQQGMIELRNKHQVWKELSQRKLNSYNYSLYFPAGDRKTNCIGEDGDWQPGDFLIHWAGQPTEIRWRELEKIWPQIIH